MVNQEDLITCSIGSCGHVFKDDGDYVTHVISAHAPARPAAAAPASGARIKATRPSVEKECRPSDWRLFVRLLVDYYADSLITDDRNKGRQLILCVPKELMSEVAIIVDEHPAFAEALEETRALLVPKIPRTQLRYEAMMKKQAEGESFRQFVAKVKTAFADVKYTPNRDNTEEVIKDVVIMGARSDEHRDQIFYLDNVDDLTLEQITEQFSKREFVSKPAQKRVAANERQPRTRDKKAESKAPGAKTVKCACGTEFFTLTYNGRGEPNKEPHKVCKACYVEERKRTRKKPASTAAAAAPQRDDSGSPVRVASIKLVPRQVSVLKKSVEDWDAKLEREPPRPPFRLHANPRARSARPPAPVSANGHPAQGYQSRLFSKETPLQQDSKLPLFPTRSLTLARCSR